MLKTYHTWAILDMSVNNLSLPLGTCMQYFRKYRVLYASNADMGVHEMTAFFTRANPALSAIVPVCDVKN